MSERSPSRFFAELVDDVNAISKHLVAVSELHGGAYARRVDVRARLEVLEAAEEERKRRDRDERSSVGSCASTPASPDEKKNKKVRPPNRRGHEGDSVDGTCELTSVSLSLHGSLGPTNHTAAATGSIA